MKPFQFTIRDLFLAITLVAVGVGCIAIALRPLLTSTNGIKGILYVGGWVSIGVGLFTPFQRNAVGAILGFVLCFALMQVVRDLR